MKNITRIVAAVVDTKQLTLYKADGETIIIPQGDPRLRRVVEQAVPQLESNRDAKGHTWADVEIDPAAENSYANFEKEGSGIVKFFRVAKAALKNLLTPVVEPVPELVAGTIPGTKERLEDIIATDRATLIQPTLEDARQDLVNVVAAVAEAKKEDELAPVEEPAEPVTPKMEQTMSAVNEIIAHAIPVTADDFHERGVAQQGRIKEDSGETIKQHGADEEEHTIIAVVGNGDNAKIIPGMEKIKSQFGRAAKLGSTKGVEAFLARLASVIENRGHSVEDLLKFMERADTPIADDGSIVIYKILNRKGDKEYLDCHSGNVTQFVGAYVCMDEKMVDPNRRNECSNGLHVARRGYLREFSGNVCVLAKLAPEDVIAVPQYDANKMRVCGYHIIAELSPAMFQSVKQNSPITTSEEGRQLLAKALAGDHIRITHEVRITGSKGGGVVITPVGKPPVAPAAPQAEVTEAVIDLTPAPVVVKEVEALADPMAEALDQPTDPRDVIKVVEKAVEAVKLTRAEEARTLYDAWFTAPDVDKGDRLAALLKFKKAAKKGWDVLGIPDPTKPTPSVFDKAPKAAPAVFDKPVKEAKVRKPNASKGTKVPAKLDEYTAKGVKAGQPVTDLSTGAVIGVTVGGPKDRITKLLALGPISASTAGNILAIKKAAKKSWDLLGVTPEQVDQIVKLTK